MILPGPVLATLRPGGVRSMSCRPLHGLLLEHEGAKLVLARFALVRNCQLHRCRLPAEKRHHLLDLLTPRSASECGHQDCQEPTEGAMGLGVHLVECACGLAV